MSVLRSWESRIPCIPRPPRGRAGRFRRVRGRTRRVRGRTRRVRGRARRVRGRTRRVRGRTRGAWGAWRVLTPQAPQTPRRTGEPGGGEARGMLGDRVVIYFHIVVTIIFFHTTPSFLQHSILFLLRRDFSCCLVPWHILCFPLFGTRNFRLRGGFVGHSDEVPTKLFLFWQTVRNYFVIGRWLRCMTVPAVTDA